MRVITGDETGLFKVVDVEQGVVLSRLGVQVRVIHPPPSAAHGAVTRFLVIHCTPLLLLFCRAESTASKP
jgi:hypothetical protein